GPGLLHLRRQRRRCPAEAAVRSLLHQEPVHRPGHVHHLQDRQDRGPQAGGVTPMPVSSMPMTSVSSGSSAAAMSVSSAASVANAMTIDVEDYFHVSNFARTVAPASWDTRE